MKTRELLKFFAVPDTKISNIYLLGCFASRVTLYSQQVRALNLIYALFKEGKLNNNSSVAVIGAGAGGLTAAAGAAHLGAKVTVIEKFQSVMELQRNNRQRWIHPFIYDWPDAESPTNRATKILLDWEAAYAENVADQIEMEWKKLVNSKDRYRINECLGIDHSKLTFREFSQRTFVSWEGTQQPFDLVILAVGFGLERHGGAKSSYWSEDDIDGGFRNDLHSQKWLISGCGDGGLTDVMRLCIRKFRVEKIAAEFERHDRIGDVKEFLRNSHRSLKKHPTRMEQEVFLAETFERLKTEYDLLKDFENKIQRKNKPEVFLTGSGPSPYGPGSSLLNRLIVCQLARNRAFTYFQGPARILKREQTAKLKVAFGAEGESVQRGTFDRVIERHGPERAIEEDCLSRFKVAFGRLKTQWGSLQPDDDATRVRQWPPTMFDRAAAVAESRSREDDFLDAVKRIGIRAESLLILKEVRGNGSSTVSYQFERLAVLSGSLSRIHFTFTSVAGSAGGFEFDSEGKRLKLKWERIEPHPSNDLAGVVDHIRQISGYIVFPEERTADDPPVSFGVSLRVLNGDALSRWEFSQMYDGDHRKHVNGEALDNEMEYLARAIWFPLDKLKMRLSLPGRVSKVPFLSVFCCGHPHPPTREDVVIGKTLEIFPQPDSAWDPRANKWGRVEDPLLQDDGMTKFWNSSAQSWELEVTKPRVASFYSMDWPLDSPSPELDDFVPATKETRRRLLEHRAARIRKERGDEALRLGFGALRSELAKLFQPKAGDGFEVSVMAYNEGDRSLQFVEAVVDGIEFPEEMRKTGFPFGIGLAGTAFKRGEIMYYQASAAVDNEPKVYLALPEAGKHEVLLSIPVDHPTFYESTVELPAFDPSRKSIGVINIGSKKSNDRFPVVIAETELLQSAVNICQDFCRGLYSKGRGRYRAPEKKQKKRI
jgi:Pyridine nucleotide-disulphide oxidoreductase